MFKGIFTALLTPFDKNNKINEKAIEKLVKHNLDMGVRGFYVCGSFLAFYRRAQAGYGDG